MPKGKVMSEWAEVHAELSNKIRWSISSTAQHIGLSLTYRDSKEWAGRIATKITEEWREKHSTTPYEGYVTPSGAPVRNGKGPRS